MIRRLVFIAVLIGAFVEAGPSVVWAGDVTVTVHKQVMAPTMELDPEKVTVQTGDSVTWENLTGQGIRVTPGWGEAQPIPHSIRPGGTPRLRFDEAEAYRHYIFAATDRFEEGRSPTAVHRIIHVEPPPP